MVVKTDSIGITDAAREIGISPNTLSVSFHRGSLPERLAPLIAGRRVIDRDDIPELRKLLIRRGYRLAPVASK
jgi:hypothetical protein